MKLSVRRVATLLFFSGACALMYQVAWFRELRLIFGASTASSAAVLAIFMGGLGLGGALLGRRADASRSPLAMYAKLEIGVSCAAGLTPLFVWAADKIYVAAGGTTSLGGPGATVVRILLAVLVLGPVTFLMGGTLPAAARAIEKDDGGARRGVATLYGVNTLGAVLGAVLANFVLLEVLGTRMTVWVTALVNVLVGVLALSFARRAGSARVSDENASASVAAAVPDAVENAPDDGARAIPRWLPPGAAALAGAAFMLMELTWYRMLGPLLGGSSYTFGLILAVALAGIGIGGAVYARTKVPATLRWFALTCSLEALFIALPYALGDDLAIVTGLLRPLCRSGFGASTVVWTSVAAIVIFPAAVISGIQFPLIIGLYGRGAKSVGRDVGAAYLANTIGSIFGSLAGGFGLVPLLGAIGVWKLVVVALAAGAVVAVVIAARNAPAHDRIPGIVRGVALAGLPLLLLLADGPSSVWRHSGIGAGRADAMLEEASPYAVAAFRQFARRGIRWSTDGVESSVALKEQNGYTFVVNGKADGHAIVDAPTQVMGGLLPALLHGSAKSALVVGLGTGSTAGWLGKVPTMERVDVVELEPAILRVAADCATVNESVLQNPKVHTYIADAREHLRTTRARYDIIFSEPSNPYRAGISSLYTVEYYRAAAERVAPAGMFVQWLQAYEIDGWVVATALTTLRQVFGDVEVWRTMAGDLLMVARAQHTPFDVARVRAMLQTEPFGRGARGAWHTDTVEGVLSHFVARSSLADALAQNGDGAINTDDQNFLEFAFARSVGARRHVDDDILKLSERLGMVSPDVVGSYDRSRILDERWLFQRAEGQPFDPPLSLGGPATLGPVLQAMSNEQPGAALRLWAKLHRNESASSAERELVADLGAHAGGDDVGAAIEASPEETRDYFRALVASEQHDDAAATAHLVRLFVRARTDPWVRVALLDEGVKLAKKILTRSPVNSRELYGALAAPFAVENLRDERLSVRALASVRLPDTSACVEAFTALEPPPFDKDVLTLRAGCYVRAKHPRAEEAERDLRAIFLVDPKPLGAAIAGPAPPPPAPVRTQPVAPPP
ncbi:MAG: hypothetical protein JWP97_1865 [Labilithrix sp.]|nr:hypothetical protein [Labilithrix sp.]